MIPCKFFQKGQCRFGNTCRFFHGDPNASSSSYVQPATSGFNQQVRDTNMPVIIDSIKKDMLEWENTNIWKLSSYGCGGFEDYSIEEVRYANWANQGNTPLEISQKEQTNQKFRREYMNTENQNTRAILEASILGKPVSQPQGVFFSQSTPQSQQPSIFGGNASANSTPASNIFGGQQQQPQQTQQGFGLFSQPAQNQSSIFGQQSPASNTNTMGMTGFQSPTNSTASTASLFGQNNSNTSTPITSIFGQSNTAAPNVNLFSTNQQQTPQSLFPFNPTNTLGQNQQQPQNSLFTLNTNQNQQSNTMQNTNSLFKFVPEAQPLQPTFQQQQPQQQQNQQTFGASTFGFNVSSANDKYIYSEESDLTPEELEAFKAQTFVECPPLKPPPKSLCVV